MSSIRIVSFVSDKVNSLLVKEENVNWENQVIQELLKEEQLMTLLNKEADYVLINQDQLVYPRPETLDVVGVLAGTNQPVVIVASLEKKLDHSILEFSDKRNAYGKVYIAGFGPGNPELLTLKTEKLLHQADIIFYDDLLDASFLDQFAGEKHYVGKRKGQHSAKQEVINDLLLQAALQGKMVVRLKGGDPLVFGRGGEEFHYLSRHFVESEIIPGITSALAAASAGVIPLTSRGISTSVAFTLGHDAIHNKLPKADTLVFYMGASQQKVWAERLQEEGWPASTPVAAVRYASMPSQEIRRYTLGELVTAEKTLAAPSLVIVGYTATRDINAMGRKWLYTGTDIEDFKEQGQVVHNPMIAIKSLEMSNRIEETIKYLNRYDRILFSTPFAVRELFELLYQVGLDARALYRLKLTSIGEATSKMLKVYGLIVEPEAKNSSADGLIKSFKEQGITNESILVPCSTSGLQRLPQGLKELGNKIDMFSIYETIQPENVSRHNLDEFYGVVFSSPTTVRNFFNVYDYFPAHLKVKSGGKYTMDVVERIVKERGYEYGKNL